MRDDLEEHLGRDPFRPFNIVVSSGHVYKITNPHLVALGKTQITLYPFKSDKWAEARLNQIVAIQSEDYENTPKRKRAG